MFQRTAGARPESQGRRSSCSRRNATLAISRSAETAACLCLPIHTLKPAADALAAIALELAPSSKEAGLLPYTSWRLILKRHILAATIVAPLVAAGCLMVVQTAVAAETASVEVAFSPNGGAENLVLSAINGAQQSIRLMAYSFTAEAVVRALGSARRRGVDAA